ncbi:MAG: sigma-70 family RNA polymerase sigma factor [Gemmataceae bacterium]
MPAAAPPLSPNAHVLAGGLVHSSFRRPNAAKRYDPRTVLKTAANYPLGYMPDEQTRDCGQRMHYAAYRVRRAKTPRERRTWAKAYYALRDRIVLGNQKLVFKAVRYRKAWQLRSDDLIGEGHVVLINAVERYNPWLGVRFSTYAFTCLVRALVRLTRKRIGQEKRFLTQCNLTGEASEGQTKADAGSSLPLDLEHYFQAQHPLLSEREKLVLQMRFGLGEQVEALKLELIGARLGLSKERIRQVQVSALTKLREAVAIAGFPIHQ